MEDSDKSKETSNKPNNEAIIFTLNFKRRVRKMRSSLLSIIILPLILGDCFVKKARAEGVKYGIGKGVDQNYVTAYAWASIAATNGDNIAPRFKSEFLEPKMTPAQIAKAEELVEEMIKKNPKLLNKK